MPNLMIVWDYDTPIARITATKPYNYVFEKCLAEEGYVNLILDTARDINAKFTFATLGFGAEKSVAPFDVRHVIKKIHAEGHEIASHSWKHEWLPFLSEYQLDMTMQRSKMILEECIGNGYKVNGFVLPHDRPMSWYSRFAFSGGDKTMYPFFPGGSIDGISKYLKKNDYKWLRVSTRPVWEKLVDWRGTNKKLRLGRKVISTSGFHYIPEHHMEFDSGAIDAVDWAVQNNKPLVIAGHPAALGFKSENLDNFKRFIAHIHGYIQQNKLEVTTVSDFLNIR